MRSRIIILSIGCLSLVTLLNAAHAQTGACCVDLECVGTMEQDACSWMCGNWYEGEDCEEGFECPTDSPCGFYVVGDYNCSGQFNVADVVDMYSKLRTGHPVYPECECDCEGDGNVWAVRGDVNNSCTFNLADVVIAYGRGWIPERCLRPCMHCPPGPEP